MAGDVREVVLPPMAGGVTPPVRQPSNSDDSSGQPEESGEPPAIPDGSSASPPEAGSPNIPKTLGAIHTQTQLSIQMKNGNLFSLWI